MTPTKLGCPQCRRTVPEAFWQGVDVVRCPACEGEFEQLRFPALAAARTVALAATTTEGEANCFFHAQNRAETACAGCGRYICSVCTVEFNGRRFCPSCLETRSAQRKLPENHRVVYDHIALALTFVPLIVWPVTLVAAPVALGLCVYGWRQPGSLVGRWRRTKFVIAGMVAAVEIGCWITLFASLLLKK